MLHEGYSLQANVKVAGLLVEFPAETGPGLLTAAGLLTGVGLAVEPAALLAAGFESVQPWNVPNQATVQRASEQDFTVSNRIFMVKLRGVVSVGGGIRA
jgi:hypothetical protein